MKIANEDITLVDAAAVHLYRALQEEERCENALSIQQTEFDTAKAVWERQETAYATAKIDYDKSVDDVGVARTNLLNCTGRLSQTSGVLHSKPLSADIV